MLLFWGKWRVMSYKTLTESLYVIILSLRQSNTVI